MSLFLSLGSLLYGQGKILNENIMYFSDENPDIREVKNTIFFEVESLSPVFKMTLDTAISSKSSIYYYFGRKIKKVSTDISYIGGFEALSRYQDSLYWANYDGEEMNGSCMYTILFDKNLKIRKIKIVKREAYNNAKYDYDKLIKEIVLSTEGNWRKEDTTVSERWYFVVGRFKVR